MNNELIKEFQNIYAKISKLFVLSKNEIVKPNPNKRRLQASGKKR